MSSRKINYKNSTGFFTGNQYTRWVIHPGDPHAKQESFKSGESIERAQAIHNRVPVPPQKRSPPSEKSKQR